MSFFSDIEENLSFLKSTPFYGELEGDMLSSNDCHFDERSEEKSPHFEGAQHRPLNTPLNNNFTLGVS
jgi:hypothetical protein